MKAKAVHVCIFTNEPPTGGAYSTGVMPVAEKNLYNAVSTAAVEAFQQEGYDGTTLSFCYAKADEFKPFLSSVPVTPPFAAIAGTFPNGSKHYYIVKSPNQVKQYLLAMWSGAFGGTGLPTNMGEGDGGWGKGDGGLLCKIFPPLCALGFLPWLALSAYTTYRAAESRSTTGRTMWAVPAFLFWQGFLARGGVKQIQWWINKIK